MLDNQSRMRSMLDLLENVDQGKKINLNEGMPSDVIKLKQKLGSMTPDQLRSRFEEVSKSTGKSVEELARSMAWRHGYGQNSSHYWNTIQRAQRGDGDNREVSEGSDENLDVETLADAALNAAALSIQDALGIETGDVAGMFFSGTKYEQIMDLLREYAELEIKLKDHEGNDQENLDEGMMKRMLEKRAENMSKEEFISAVDEHGMDPEDAAEFWTAVNGEDELDEEQDPNLAKAYRMGNEAYKAFKNDSARAQAAQDKMEAEFPQYVQMWTTGYRDGERFDKQSGKLEEAVSRKDFRQVADIIKEIPDETKRRELADHHCEIFKQQNPRFSREKFMNYIGL